MLFMIGINQGRKELAHNQMVICNQCGAYGRYTVFMTYMCLSLFFIPCFKWSKQYFVQSSCCHTIYALSEEIGKAIARGEAVEIRPEHLTVVQKGYRSKLKSCGNCGYETSEDFEFCPKCGRRFDE